MKKIFITLMIGVLLVGLTVAGVGLSSPKKDVDLSTEDKNELARMGITTPIQSPLECNGDYCEVCLKDGKVGAGCVRVEQTYCSGYNHICEEWAGKDCAYYNEDCNSYSEYSTAELESMIDVKVIEVLEGIAEGKRNEILKEEKNSGSVIVIK
tara:strand:+ start:596 stop:1054 length:459 start_codon:yes stop_codon:yes gene_type:complete